MSHPSLTDYDLTRYNRQIMLFGEEAQQRLKGAKVFVAGAGGLGCPLATYLAVAGIGHIRLVDSDEVELSNLNRQILHWDEDEGSRKVESALAKLRRMNPSITIEAPFEHIDEGNVETLVSDADAIVDCMDNFPTRYLLTGAAIQRRIPLFHAAVYGMEARVSTIVPGETACLRCLFPTAPPAETFPVLGSAPGLAATIQAMEVIKYFAGYGKLLKNRMLVFDGEMSRFIDLTLQRDLGCPDCGSL